MQAPTKKVNSKGETIAQFKRRFMPSNYVEVTQSTGVLAQTGEYFIKRHGKLLAVIDALHVDDAIAQAKNLFNMEAIAVL